MMAKVKREENEIMSFKYSDDQDRSLYFGDNTVLIRSTRIKQTKSQVSLNTAVWEEAF